MTKSAKSLLPFFLLTVFGCSSFQSKTGEEQALRQPAKASACDLAITSVNVIDLEERKIKKNMDVLIAGGVISEVKKHGADSPPCAQTIDGKDQYLMPGFVDMHTHADAIFLPRAQNNSVTEAIPLTLEQSGAMMLRAGVTGFLDLCSHPQNEIFKMRDQQRQGRLKIDMPDIFAAGSCITSKWYKRTGDPNQYNDEKEIADVTLLEKVDDYPKAYPTKDGETVYGYVVKEKESELKKVDALLEKNPDVIKVFYTISWDEGAHYPSLHLDTIKEIVKRAHKKKIPVLAHALSWREHLELLTTGIDGFAHAANEALEDRSALSSFHPKNPMVVIPTLTVFGGLGRLGKLNSEINDPLLADVLSVLGDRAQKRILDEFKHMPPDIRKKMAEIEKGYAQMHGDMIDNVKMYKNDRSHRFRLLAGTDASNLGVFLGFAMHQELDEMVNEVGLSTWDALAAATIEPGRYLKASYGTKAGNVANLILLKNSPIEDIRNTRSIERVILHGKAL